MRRRLLMLAGVAVLALTNTGCFLNVYSSDPNIRMEQLLNQSEDLRQIEYEWRRFWFTDQPSHMTPVRVEDIHATVLTALGLDLLKENISPAKRPIRLSQGTALTALVE